MFLKKHISNLLDSANQTQNAESNLDSATQNLVKKDLCEAPENSPASWCKKSGEASSSGKADFLLEAEKRGSPPKSEKRQLLARRGSVVGGAALLREELSEISSNENAESSLDSAVDCHADSANLLAMTENRDSSPMVQNDNLILNLTFFAESSKISQKYAIKG